MHADFLPAFGEGGAAEILAVQVDAYLQVGTQRALAVRAQVEVDLLGSRVPILEAFDVETVVRRPPEHGVLGQDRRYRDIVVHVDVVHGFMGSWFPADQREAFL